MGIRTRFRIGTVPIIFLGCFISILIATLYFSSTVLKAAGWSWLDMSPTIASSTKVAVVSSRSSCSHQYTLEKIAGKTEPIQICKSKDGPISMGWYFAGDHFEYVIGFGEFGKMYPFHNGACERYDSCIYIPETDTLIARLYYGNNGGRSLAIYDNFSTRAYRIFQDNLLTPEYGFDTSNPAYTFKSSKDVLWEVGGVGVSDNGRWLAIELKQRGIAILNLETFDVRRISTHHFDYGLGRDPTSELAISNDGQYIAVMGENAGIALFRASELCGEPISDLIMYSADYMEKPCPTSPINRFALIDNGFLAALHPHFESDGAELQFYVQSYSGEQREILLRAVGFQGPRMDYLALGDSFSSGEGETQDSYYQNGTNVEFEKCHVSTRSYPYLIAQYLGIEERYVRNMACSGAKTEDVIGDESFYNGQSNRLTTKGLSMNDSAKTLAQTAAKEEFIPGRIHQGAFVKRYQPKLITIGIGGNDAGLMQKLRSCVGPGDCEWAVSPTARQNTAIEIQAIFTDLVNTYTNLHESSPNSKIYVIGYPNIVDPEGSCGVLEGALLSRNERVFMKQSVMYLNQVVAAAAKRAGVAYIDIEHSLEPQTLCGTTIPSVINSVKTGDDNLLIEKLDWTKVLGQESFHPQPKAHSLISSTITSTYGNLLTYQSCQSGIAVCPDSNITTPQLPLYWLSGTSDIHSIVSQRQVQFTSDGATNTNNQIRINMPQYSFAPDTLVNVEIHSNALQLGALTASGSGAASSLLYIPSNLEPGLHMIHLLGTDFAGEAVDYYQLFTYSHVSSSGSEMTVTTGGSKKLAPTEAISSESKAIAEGGSSERRALSIKESSGSTSVSSTLSPATGSYTKVPSGVVAQVTKTVNSMGVLIFIVGLAVVGLTTLLIFRICK